MNPFRFETPLDPSALIGRDNEIAQLVTYAKERRIVSVAAPRRYGKTSLLRAAGGRLQERDGFVVVHVDLLGLAGPDDFAARFGTAWRRAVHSDRHLRRELERLVGGLGSFGVTLLGSGVQVSRRERAGVLSVVHALLDLPGEAGRPVLVVLDEFQALHGVWPEGEGVLRSQSQSPEQAGKVAYAFAGSEPSLLEAAFADQGRAYYQQVLQLPLGRLADRDLSLGIARLFARTEKDSGTALGPLVQLVAGHPQRAMLLAHLLWDATTRRAAAGAEQWQRALSQARTLTSDEAQAIWESLTPVQRAALRSVVLHASPTVVEADPAVSKGSRQSAATLLLRRGLVESDPAPGPRGGRRYRLVDPMLDDWVRQRRT
jgi:hypothetical protein